MSDNSAVHGELGIDWTTREVPLSSLYENDYNPRRSIDDVSDLSGSVDQFGVRGALEVRPMGDGWEVISGSRRLEALRKKFGVESDRMIPVRDAGTIDDETALRIARTENMVRKDLKPMDEARDFARSVTVNGIPYIEYVEMLPDSLRASAETVAVPSGGCADVQAVASDISQSSSTVSKRISLLLLPERMYEWVDNHDASEDIYPQLPVTAAANIISACRSFADDPEESLTLIECVAEEVAATTISEQVTTTDRGGIQTIVTRTIDEMDFLNSIGEHDSVDLTEVVDTDDSSDSNDNEDESCSIDFDALEADSDVETEHGRIVVDVETIKRLEHTCPVCNRPFEDEDDGSDPDAVMETLDEYCDTRMED